MEPCKAPRLEGAGKKHGISTICFTHFFPLKFAISPCNVGDQRYQISDDDSGPPRIQGFMEPTEVELRLPRFSLLETLRVALYRSPFLMGFCLAGGFTYFPGEMVQFDEYFSNGLVQPPTSCFWWKNTTSSPWNWRRHTFHSKIPLNSGFQRGKIGICRDPQIIYIDIQQKRSFVLGVFLVEKWFQGLPPPLWLTKQNPRRSSPWCSLGLPIGDSAENPKNSALAVPWLPPWRFTLVVGFGRRKRHPGDVYSTGPLNILTYPKPNFLTFG